MKRWIVPLATLVAGAAAGGLLPHPNGVAPALQPLPEAPPPTSTKRQGTQGLVVYVAGEVARPGVYAFVDGQRADSALKAAGGATSLADPVAVNLAERLHDGEEIVVPKRGAEVAAMLPYQGRAQHAARPRRRQPRHSPAPAVASDEPVDLNSASALALAKLPGLSPRLAERILAFRVQFGRFATLDELADVAGMSESRIERLAPYVIVR